MSRKDFSQTNVVHTRGELAGNSWIVWPHYELEEDPKYGTLAYGEVKCECDYPPYLIKSNHKSRTHTVEKLYSPLEEAPDLFLNFARLYEEGFSVERILDWVHRYGTLYHNNPPKHSRSSDGNTVRDFWGEVCWAAGVLAMYEVVLNKDENKAQRLAQDMFYFLLSVKDISTFPGSSTLSCGYDERGFGYRNPLRKKYDGEEEVIAKFVDLRFDGEYLAFALGTAVWAVNEVIQEFCYPTLHLKKENAINPAQIKEGWGFRNLLGAMYMQMRWLMAAGAELKRCEYCGWIISFAPASPDARKPRADKKFCGKSCRQNYDYHNRIKPQRQSRGTQS